MTDIYLILEANEPESLRQDGSPLLVLAEQLQLDLIPVHPGIQDTELKRHYIARMRVDGSAKKIIEQLQRCSSVEAAYTKPSGEPP